MLYLFHLSFLGRWDPAIRSEHASGILAPNRAPNTEANQHRHAYVGKFYVRRGRDTFPNQSSLHHKIEWKSQIYEMFTARYHNQLKEHEEPHLF